MRLDNIIFKIELIALINGMNYSSARQTVEIWRDLRNAGGLRPPGSSFLAGSVNIWRESRHPAGVE